MARRSRKDEIGAWHHVMNRGLARRTFFEGVEDRRFFLAQAARSVRRGELAIHAFSLLDTHFHLLVQSLEGRLSYALARIQNVYVRRFNRLRRRDGSLVRGRFRSGRVQSEIHRRLLVGYIDDNSVDAGLAVDAHDYPWSSAAHHALDFGRPWLCGDWIEEELAARRRPNRSRIETYQASFPTRVTPGLRDWFMRRIDYRGIVDDPLDSLVRARPDAVLSWMRRKSALADGTQPWYPLAPAEWISNAVDEARDELLRTTRDRSNADHDASVAAKVALLISVAALKHAEVATLTRVPGGSIGRLVRRHEERMLDEAYAGMVARIVSAALAPFGALLGPMTPTTGG